MTLPTNIKHFFFETLIGNISVLEFEQWLYSNTNLESILPADDYLDLISHNYKRSGAKHDLYKLLEKHINKGEYEKWKLLKLLSKALDRDKELPQVLISFYNLYCKGYYFLDNLGLGYGLSVDFPYSMADSWDELSDIQQKNLLDSFYPEIEIEIKKVIEWLENEKIILTGIKDEYDHYGFIDNRTELEKKSTGFETVLISKPKQKAWWKFW